MSPGNYSKLWVDHFKEARIETKLENQINLKHSQPACRTINVSHHYCKINRRKKGNQIVKFFFENANKREVNEWKSKINLNQFKSYKTPFVCLADDFSSADDGDE